MSPTPPITVTHKPEEDTFGVSHFLVKRKVFTDAVVFRLLFLSRQLIQTLSCLELWHKEAMMNDLLSGGET